jgi:hypothetical protein
MITEFEPVIKKIQLLVNNWEPKLSELSNEVITERRNSQNRTIKQILGHLIDSASNNIHRFVHLQYRESPLNFPNYASEGNNDSWIAIQHYQEEDWQTLIALWKYTNYHVVHVIRHMNAEKLDHVWIASADRNISLREMVTGYLTHFELHLKEIQELMPKV